MKKLQLNKLSLKNLATPLLALSLSLGCIGLFNGSTFAASVSFLATPRPVTPPITSVQPPVGDWVLTSTDHDNVGGYGIDWSDCSSAIFTKMTVKYTIKNDPRNFTTDPGGMQGYYFTFVGNKATMTGFSLTAISGGFQSGSSNNLGIGMDTVGRGYAFNMPSSGDIEFSSNLANYTVSDLSDILIATYNGDGNTVGASITQPQVTLTYDDSSCPVISPSPDTSTTTASTPVTINILGNDSGTGLSISKIDNQDIVVGQTITLTNGSGTVKLNTDGTITFTPASTFQGESSFSYSITDGTSTVDTGAVKVTVASATTPEPVTPNQDTPVATNRTTTKPMLANTGENVRSLMIAFTTLLVLAGYFKFKNKRVQEYRK